MLYFCLVTLVVNVVVCFTCLQHRLPNFVRNGLKYPIFLDLLLVHATFPLTMFLLSSKYWRFLFLLYASNVSPLNVCWSSWLMWIMLGSLVIKSFTFGKVWLQVKTNGNLFTLYVFVPLKFHHD